MAAGDLSVMWVSAQRPSVGLAGSSCVMTWDSDKSHGNGWGGGGYSDMTQMFTSQ